MQTNEAPNLLLSHPLARELLRESEAEYPNTIQHPRRDVCEDIFIADPTPSVNTPATNQTSSSTAIQTYSLAAS